MQDPDAIPGSKELSVSSPSVVELRPAEIGGSASGGARADCEGRRQSACGAGQREETNGKGRSGSAATGTDG
jgi:hypothetical protein